MIRILQHIYTHAYLYMGVIDSSRVVYKRFEYDVFFTVYV